MSSHRFDPTQYKGKKTIYRKVPNQTNICTIWDWSDRSKKYVKRTIGEKYYAYVRRAGSQVSQCFRSMDEAKDFVRFRGQMPEVMADMTFSEVKRRFFEKYEKEVSLSSVETMIIKTRLLSYFDDFGMEQITPRLVDQWLLHLKSPKVLKTQQKTRMTYEKEVSALRQICLFYQEYYCEDHAYLMPIKKRHMKDCIIDPQKYKQRQSMHRTKFLPREMIQAFLSEMRRRGMVRNTNRVYYLIALFQARTGCRIGEVCSLSWKDIDLKSLSAHIHQTVAWSRKKGRKSYISPLTKTGESRRVFFTDDVARELREWIVFSGRRSGLIFSRDGKKPIEYRCVQHAYDKALETIGTDYRGTHIMRHSYATDVLAHGGDQVALQAQLGHRSSQQTSHYAKITDKTKQEGARQYNDTFLESDFDRKSAAGKRWE